MRSDYVGWAGKTLTLEADQPLGYGSLRGFPQYGIRRAIWDACCGFVNGFKLSAILYYVVTRSLNRRFCQWVMEREGWTFINGVPVAGSREKRLSHSNDTRSES